MMQPVYIVSPLSGNKYYYTVCSWPMINEGLVVLVRSCDNNMTTETNASESYLLLRKLAVIATPTYNERRQPTHTTHHSHTIIVPIWI